MSAKQPSNRAIAAAIAELGEQRLEELAAYARTCIDLVAAGIPRVELALALDCETVEQTESTQKLEQWAREPMGALAIVGPPGAGKSFAAALTVIARERAGLRSRWLAAVSWDGYSRDAQRQWLAECSATALAIVDDLGAGVMGSGGFVQRAAESEIEGALIKRIGDGKPTLVLANGTRETIEQQLGARLVSRMRDAGGFVFLPETSPDLRGRVKPPPVNSSGRWPRWQQAQDLLDLVGHDDVGSWHRLHRRASDAPTDRDASREWLRSVAAKLEIDPVAVRRRALDYKDRDDAICREMSRVLGVDVDEYSLAGVRRALGAKLAAQRERESRSTAAPDELKRRCVYPTGPHALDVCRRTKPLGFTVTALGESFDLRFRGQVKGGGYPTPDAAWLDADKHTGGWADPSKSIDRTGGRVSK